MELIAMTRPSNNNIINHSLSSRLSSILHSHLSRSQRLPRKPTIPNPRQSIVSSPPSRRSSPPPQDLDLQARAISTLNTLRSSSESGSSPSLAASDYIGPDVTIHRDDDSITQTRDEFVSSWRQDQMGGVPADYQVEVVEAVVDEAQRKVWVRSEISGGAEGGVRRQSVDMMIFDEEGLLVACAGSQTVIGKRQRIVGE